MEWRPSLTARELWQDGVNTSRSYSTSVASLDEIPTMDEMARAIAGLNDGKALEEMEFLQKYESTEETICSADCTN